MSGDPKPRLTGASDSRPLKLFRTVPIISGISMSLIWSMIQVLSLSPIIAGAGGAAHLPGMTAAKTTLPVLGVPVQSKALSGLDSLLSIVQMPAGVPVATFAIGEAGAANAALCAAAILANRHPEVDSALAAFRRDQTAAVLAQPDPRTART